MGNSHSDEDPECFYSSGPEHISAIDWGNEGHRRCITACLVRATYILESDRTKGRQDTPGARAPAWWRTFDLRLHRRLLCDNVCTCVFCGHEAKTPCFIYGAIFEHLPPPEGGASSSAPHPPPRFIVAFRGTKLRSISDIKDDFRIIFNRQDKCIRFGKAREHVEELLLEATGGDGGVWLAGHSLGASVALEVGRDLVIRRALKLPTFLFNPPHVSFKPIATALHMSEVAKLGCRAECMVKGAAAALPTMRPHKKRMEALFQKLGTWVPELYVHKDDVICQGYIDHFEQQEKVRAELTGIFQPLARLGMRHSFRDMAKFVRHKDNHQAGPSVDDDGEAEVQQQRVQPHLLPSVRLWKNSTKTTGGLFHAHKLKHWWKPDGALNLSTKGYRYEFEA